MRFGVSSGAAVSSEDLMEAGVLFQHGSLTCLESHCPYVVLFVGPFVCLHIMVAGFLWNKWSRKARWMPQWLLWPSLGSHFNNIHLVTQISPTQHQRKLYKVFSTRRQRASEAILKAGYIHLFKVLLYATKLLEKFQSNTRGLLLKAHFKHPFHVTVLERTDLSQERIWNSTQLDTKTEQITQMKRRDLAHLQTRLDITT